MEYSHKTHILTVHDLDARTVFWRKHTIMQDRIEQFFNQQELENFLPLNNEMLILRSAAARQRRQF